MKKNMIIFLSFIGLSVFFICLLQKEKTLDRVENPGSIELAIYVNDEESSTIPLKDTGYIFDTEKSSCTNNAVISWDSETWSPVIKNMSEYKTRCTLAFRDYYRVTVLDGNDSQIYSVSFNHTSTSIEASVIHTLLKCNQGVELTYTNGNIVVNNIQSDVSCSYYDSSVDAINSLDDSENYFIYLKDENIDNELTINEGKSLTMDLNGYTLASTKSISNYDYLLITSSSSDYGSFILNENLRFLFASYKTSELYFNHVEFSVPIDVVDVYDEALFTSNDSRLISENTEMSSTVWLHGGKTTTEIYNSYIEGPFAVGGEGGKILIDSSQLVGDLHTGLQVNSGYSGNVILQNNSTIFGTNNAISMADGSLTLGSDVNDSVIIRGNGGIRVGYGTNSFDINYNAGDIYGAIQLNTNGKINVIAGKTMVSVEENGVLHTYLQ